jgi:hypothetical protein
MYERERIRRARESSDSSSSSTENSVGGRLSPEWRRKKGYG